MSDDVQPVDDHFPGEEPEVFPRLFGNYLLLHRLARGGMGEVYLAKTGGLAGIEKHCVVKTLRPHFTSDREYVTRFIDEARVVVGLTHRNIAQTFDVGRVGHQYYLAMEYIPGMDIRSIQDRFQERKGGENLDEALSLHQVCEVLEALDYAHRAKSPQTGKQLHLVHRDISPQNVMVNFEGEVKLIDFGLAQSTTKEEHTQPHMVMGKMAYMSPEQARGQLIDASADQFAVAVVLYELLVGERYYGKMNPEQIWAVAGRGDWLPPRLGELPKDLARVLKRALDPDPKRRFASCGDFREELIGYQYAHGMRAGSREIRALMHDLYSVEQQQHEALVAHYAGVRLLDFVGEEQWPTPSGKLPVPQAPVTEETVSFVPSTPNLKSFGTMPVSNPGARAPLSEKGTEPTGETTRVPRSPGESVRRRALPLAAGAVLVLMLIVGVVIGLSSSGDEGAGDGLVITEVHAAMDLEPGEAPKEATSEGEPQAQNEAPPDDVAMEPSAAVVVEEQAPKVESEAPKVVRRPARPSKRRLPDSVIAQSPQRPIEKIKFLQNHCLERVSCARRLANIDKIDPAELERRNTSGQFDQCIRRCKND